MNYDKILQYRNLNNSFGLRLGIVAEEIHEGYARVVKTVEPDDTNPLHIPHGGIYFTMADTACGSAMASHGYLAVTANSNYNFYRSAKVGDKLTAVATELKYGKTICTYDVKITDQNQTLLGSGTFTFYRTNEKIDLNE